VNSNNIIKQKDDRRMTEVMEIATPDIKENNLEKKKLTPGTQMYDLIARLYPICRSITGEGVVETLNYVKKYIPLQIYQVPTGTKVFDWEVPREWNIKDAYVMNSRGEKVIDFANSNLHVLNYSIPVCRNVTLTELKEHLHTLPEHPDWIPYRTSYYKEDWGFCVSYNQYKELNDDRYEVHINSTLENGNLTYGEYFIPGELTDEVLLSTHICHPSLCNDNLSGLSVLTFLAKALSAKKLRYSYRFLFIPGTIGAITWLSVNESKTANIRHGLIASLLGDPGAFIYKKSRRGDTEIDRVVTEALRNANVNYKIVDFSPYGYDERQFCSPGFNLAVGCLSRSQYGQFPEYHTSADNMDFVQPNALESSLQMYLDVINMLEKNRKYMNVYPKCEPQLGKRGLYEGIGGDNHGKEFQMALLWVLNLSDGTYSLLDISKRSGISFDVITEAAERLAETELLHEVQTVSSFFNAPYSPTR
jgi:aminopeptidase-like protein